jgi:hypothetical protein
MGTSRDDYCYGQSSFMKADDWLGKSVRACIEGVEDVEFEKGLKPVLKLRGQEKKLVVNATNFDILAEALGNNPTKWPGHVILLEGIKVPFKGKRVPSIRVGVPAALKKSESETDPDFDDDLPPFAA